MATIILLSGTPAFAQHCDVKNGDSLWLIAKRYHVSFKQLLELNKHFPNQDLIFPKDEVELPDKNETDTSDRLEKTNALEVLNLVNKERKNNGLSALILDDKLNKIATIKSNDMRDNDYFSHNSPTYGSPFDMLKKFNVDYKHAGENIASGQKTPEAVMNSWMNSSGHRANILSKNYKKMGVGFSVGGRSDTYWTQLFTS